jgi:sulfide:quinone oxidoreductase
MQIYKLTETCSVAGQIQPADVETLKQTGYVAVVCNRPDDEDFGQPPAVDIEKACDQYGVAFYHLPISNAGINADMVTEFQRIIAESNGPVLAYCRSGQRSSVLWQYGGSP